MWTRLLIWATRVCRSHNNKLDCLFSLAHARCLQYFRYGLQVTKVLTYKITYLVHSVNRQWCFGISILNSVISMQPKISLQYAQYIRDAMEMSYLPLTVLFPFSCLQIVLCSSFTKSSVDTLFFWRFFLWNKKETLSTYIVHKVQYWIKPLYN